MTRQALLLWALGATLWTASAGMVRADHACDPLGEEGWRTVASHETVAVVDSTPVQVGADWFIDRTTTVVPFCNYINAAGNYSLRSYSLAPEEKKDRVRICQVTGGSISAVPPYGGPCPPK